MGCCLMVLYSFCGMGAPIVGDLVCAVLDGDEM